MLDNEYLTVQGQWVFKKGISNEEVKLIIHVA